MYKDVWKKIGVKVLIVVCSVLALGGLAIAAPRLQASPSDPAEMSNEEGGFESGLRTAEVRSGSAISMYTFEARREYTFDIDNFETNKTALNDNKFVSFGAVVKPSNITYSNNNGTTGTLKENEYEITTKMNQDEWRNANTTGIDLEAEIITGTHALFQKGERFKFKYYIDPGVAGSSSNMRIKAIDCNVVSSDNKSGEYLLKNDADTINEADIEVKLKVTKGSSTEELVIPVSAKQYSVGTVTALVPGNQSTAQVHLNNFYSKRDEKVQNWNANFFVRRHVETLVVEAYGQQLDNKSIKIPLNVTSVQDINGFKIYESTDSSKKNLWPDNVSAAFDDKRSYLQIEGKSGTKYGGTSKISVSLDTQGASLDIEGWKSIVTYNSKANPEGYKQPNLGDATYTMSSGVKVVIPVGSYEVTYTKDDSKNEVTMDFQGMDNYASYSYRTTYNLSRSLEDAEITWNGAENYIYNGDEQVPNGIKVQYRDGDKTTVINSGMYTITYSNTNGGEGNKINAGTVTVTATGNVKKGEKGFFGSTTRTYEIKPKTISSVVLNKKFDKITEAGLQYQYFCTGVNAEVTTGVIAIPEDSYDELTDLQYGLGGTDCQVKVYKDGTTQVTEYADVGRYRVDYQFVGNYTSKLIQVWFKIYTYSIGDCDIKVNLCDGETENSGHVYNGKPHNPTVTVTHLVTNKLIPSTAYTITWESNTTDARDGVILTVTGIDKTIANNSKTASYNIKPYDLTASGELILPSPTFGTGTDEGAPVRTYQYIGKQKPEIIPYPSSLSLNLPDGVSLSLNQKAGAADTTKYAYSSITLQGSKTGKNDYKDITVPNGYPNTDMVYRFKVEGTNNYSGSALTETFKLSGKSINEVNGVAIQTNALPYSSTADKKYYEDLLKQEQYLKITDSTTKETLEQGVDFKITEIEPKNATDDQGKITVTIEGMGGYTNSRNDITIFVGESIEDAYMYWNRNIITKGEDGRYWLPKDMTFAPNRDESGKIVDGYKGIAFAKDNSETYNAICLSKADSTSSPFENSKLLKYDVQYTTSFGGFNSENEAAKRVGSVTVIGQHGYYGTKTIYFYVEQIDFTKNNKDYEVTFDPEVIEYTGRPISSDVTVQVKKLSTGEIVSPAALCYQVDWVDDTNVGKATVIISGRNDYTGKLERQYTIEKRNLKTLETKEKDDRVDYIACEGLELSYPYEVGGVRPECSKVYFYPDGDSGNSDKFRVELIRGTDYTITYHNIDHYYVWDGSIDTYYDEKRPCVEIIGKGPRFIGSIRKYFDITKVDLNDCDIEVSITDQESLFAGDKKEPKVVVRLKSSNNVVYNKEGEEEQYTLEWPDEDLNTFVSYKGQEGFVVVTATKKGDLEGTLQVPFKIKGDINPAKGSEAAKYSKLTFSPEQGKVKYKETTNPEEQPFDVNDAFSTITYWQRAKNLGDIDASKLETETALKDNQFRSAKLDKGTHYTISCDGKTMGEWDATIKANEEESNFKGQYNTKILITAEFSNASYTELGEISSNKLADITSGAALKMSQLISPVVCGGRPLTYGEDYVFGKPENISFEIGKTHTLHLVPTEKTKKYLLGSCDINYTIKQGIEDATITGLKETYTYAHGDPVVTASQIRVEHGGKLIDQNADYTITIEDEVNVTDKGGLVTIKGAGKYTGTITRKFMIEQYDLEEGYKKKEIAVDYEETVDYTGQEVTPKNITVFANAGADNQKTLEEGKDYQVVSGTGDNINYTKEGAAKPTLQIIPASKNYKGSIELKYSILRLNIEDEEIVFEDILDRPYRNGKDITPIPKATFHKITDLKGLLHDDTANYDNIAVDFTFEYETKDRHNVGEKVIRIRGFGNFYGERVVKYQVIPKDLSEDDVVLTFTNGMPVYNGDDQCPDFRLTYDGDVILEYTNSVAMSACMKDPIVDVVNAKNVGDNSGMLTVKANTEKDQNYIKEKSMSFSIEPASFTNHVKFMYYPEGGTGAVNLNNYRLNLPFNRGNTVKPTYATDTILKAGEIGIFYDDVKSANNNKFLTNDDYDIAYKYVVADSEDEDVREEFREPNPELSYAGKVKVTITGKGNYKDEASYWYYIGKDISADASIRLKVSSTVYNAQEQAPVEIVSGVEDGEYIIVKYRDEVAEKNIIEKGFIDAGTYYVRIEGDPTNGTFSSKPHTLTYKITPRAISKDVVVDGFKREYQYTGAQICPVGIAVTDYIDKAKYKLAENVDYTLSYANNINIGTATITVNGINNFSGTGSGQFLITTSTISNGNTLPGNSYLEGTGEISGSKAVAASDVKLTMDTTDAMYYTGSPLYPRVSISGMTENVDYTVTYSSNTEVGIGVINIAGIGNNSGTITRYFRIIASLSKCTVGAIPTQEYTGSPVKPTVVVRCGNTILKEGTDYTVSYVNNVNIGTATVMIRSASNQNYTGSTTATFKIGNDMGAFLVTGYAPSVVYTGEALTPGVIVESGNTVLTQGIDYTVSYRNNVEVGVAEIIVTGIGKYDGSQTVNFIIEARNLDICDVSDVENKTYTGTAYTPAVTVSDNGTVLTNGVDYTITYKNNVNPGTASIVIEPVNKNYAGSKTINFQISGVAVAKLKVSSIKNSSLSLSWARQDYASGYQICNAQSRVLKTVASNKNTAKMTGLSGGTTYQYKVRSYVQNADGTRSYGGFSSVVSATTKLKTPSVKLYASGAGQARVEWNAVAGAAGYEVYYKGSKSASYRKVKTINKANVRVCKINGLKANQKCYVRVRAFKRSGSKKVYSDKSAAKKVKIR